MKDLPQKISHFVRTNELPGEAAHMKMAPKSRVRTSRAKEYTGFDPKLSAVMILLYPKDGIWHNALIQRPSYQGVHSAQMSFPGGKQEETDKDFAHTALRETEEEIGIPQHQISLISELTEVYIPPSNFLVKPFVGITEENPNFIKQNSEVDEIIEYPIVDLLSEHSIKEKDIVFANGFKIKTPYFDINGKVVWGATAIMLSEFKEILIQIGFGDEI